MKKDNVNISLKDFIENDKEFINALDDALIIDKLKTPTKFSIEVEDIEEKIIKMFKTKNNFSGKVLIANYKRYLYKHILELEKLNNT